MTVPLPHRLDQTLIIQARPEAVFDFFTSSAKWAKWWGAGSTIESRPGGHVHIRYPNGVEVSGEVLELQPSERLVFTYGYASGTPMPPGGSRVTIRLTPHPRGTLLQLTHEFSELTQRDQHVDGWRFQLSLFANTVANDLLGDIDDVIDTWFAAWNVSDHAERTRLLETGTVADVHFEDRFSCLTGVDDLQAHIAGMHTFMAGMRLERRGVIRRGLWTVLVDWVAMHGGDQRGSGTNVFTLTDSRRVQSVVGVWNA